MNAGLLIYKIGEKGFELSEVAELMEVDQMTLYRKLAGFDKMTIRDAERLKNVLGLTTLEALRIFLDR